MYIYIYTHIRLGKLTVKPRGFSRRPARPGDQKANASGGGRVPYADADTA